MRSEKRKFAHRKFFGYAHRSDSSRRALLETFGAGGPLRCTNQVSAPFDLAQFLITKCGQRGRDRAHDADSPHASGCPVVLLTFSAIVARVDAGPVQPEALHIATACPVRGRGQYQICPIATIAIHGPSGLGLAFRRGGTNSYGATMAKAGRKPLGFSRLLRSQVEKDDRSYVCPSSVL